MVWIRRGGRERRNKWGPTQSCRERHSGRTLTTDASLARLASPRSFSLLPLPPFSSLSSPPPSLSSSPSRSNTEPSRARRRPSASPCRSLGIRVYPCSACQTRNPSPSCAHFSISVTKFFRFFPFFLTFLPLSLFSLFLD